GRLLRAGARGGRRHGGDDRARRRDQPLDPRRDRAALAPGCTLGPAPLPDPRLRGIPPAPRAPTVTSTVPTGGARNAPRRCPRADGNARDLGWQTLNAVPHRG